MKQARAFGLGVVARDAEPDGHRLQGRCRTPARGSSAGCRPSATRRGCSTGSKARSPARAAASIAPRPIARCRRCRSASFFLHNVHDDGPVIFQTRWAMSYLRGPLTREQIREGSASRSTIRGCSPAAASRTAPDLARPLSRHRGPAALAAPWSRARGRRCCRRRSSSSSLPATGGPALALRADAVRAGQRAVRRPETRCRPDADGRRGSCRSARARSSSTGRPRRKPTSPPRISQRRPAGRRDVRVAARGRGQAGELSGMAEGLRPLAAAGAGADAAVRRGDRPRPRSPTRPRRSSARASQLHDRERRDAAKEKLRQKYAPKAAIAEREDPPRRTAVAAGAGAGVGIEAADRHLVRHDDSRRAASDARPSARPISAGRRPRRAAWAGRCGSRRT